MLIEIILGVIVFIASILLIILIYKNKFNLYKVKIDEAENNVDILLQKKVDLLNKIAPIINKFLKSDDFLCELKIINIKQNRCIWFPLLQIRITKLCNISSVI